MGGWGYENRSFLAELRLASRAFRDSSNNGAFRPGVKVSGTAAEAPPEPPEGHEPNQETPQQRRGRDGYRRVNDPLRSESERHDEVLARR